MHFCPDELQVVLNSLPLLQWAAVKLTCAVKCACAKKPALAPIPTPPKESTHGRVQDADR